MIGRVTLVGAGPGAADLLTLRAVARLREAQLVLHDALVLPEALDLARQARQFFVGRRAGRAGLSSESIQRLMICEARRGLRVVRLKCGDPLVFAHGGEEALALAAAGVPCEIVPGVSAALAAPGLVGIPVTHRELASGFVIVSGHAPAAYRPILSGLLPQSATVVVLMGGAATSDLARYLRERGWRATTPAAVIFGAAHPSQRVWWGDLDRLPTLDQRAFNAAGAPATLVVGETVAVGLRLCGSRDRR